MWSYYGRKSKVIDYYPDPLHETIIEPFAGTAVYSLHKNNWQKDVVLVDKYEVIIRIWKYLQQATSKDILALPSLAKGDKVDDFSQLIDEEKWLIGFCINRGNPRPVKTANNYNSWDADKVRIANDLYKIRHWSFIHGDYKDIENREATWFIDPPYQRAGYKYKHNSKSLDFNELATWCKSRLGQVIVCENMSADWLPFEPLKQMRGVQHTTTEAMFYIENKSDISEKEAV